jgi:hypothetical protein
MTAKLPPLARLASFEKAAEPGLSVEECVKRLKRFHYSLWRLHQICIAHITAGLVSIPKNARLR